MNHLSRIAAVLLLTFPGAAGAQANPDRGMWVWESAPILRDARERRASSFAGIAIHRYGTFRYMPR